MGANVTVRTLAGKQLLGVARTHAVVTDRPLDESGTDTGFTSSEMLLLAIGSCAAGSIRGCLQESGAASTDVTVDVFFEPAGERGARDRIVIGVEVDEAVGRDYFEAIVAAATEGGVTSRIRLGSDLQVRVVNRGRQGRNASEPVTKGG